MSWKIYNGFILNNIATLEKALEFSKKLIPQFNELADEYWKKLIISHAVSEFDNDNLDRVELPKNYLSISSKLMWEHERESCREGTKSFTNVSISLSFTPAKVKGKKRIIGILFTDNRDILKAFFNLSEVEEYCFFDNSDQPEKISEADWQEREKVWKSVFANASTASKVMLVFDIISEKEGTRYPTIEEADIEKYQGTWEDRVKGALNYHILKDRNFTAVSDYLKFIRSEESEAARNAARETVEQKVKKNLTLSDLTLNHD
jgi:hypothetical protein